MKKIFLIRHARPIGWGLTALSLLLASIWLFHPFGPPNENYMIMWSLIYGIIIITGSIMTLSVKSKCHDLILAGILAFYSPIAIYYSVFTVVQLFK